jgi:hypothetical protein
MLILRDGGVSLRSKENVEKYHCLQQQSPLQKQTIPLLFLFYSRLRNRSKLTG